MTVAAPVARRVLLRMASKLLQEQKKKAMTNKTQTASIQRKKKEYKQHERKEGKEIEKFMNNLTALTHNDKNARTFTWPGDMSLGGKTPFVSMNRFVHQYLLSNELQSQCERRRSMVGCRRRLSTMRRGRC